MRTVLLLLASNCFMTLAWYGHLAWFGRERASTAPLCTIIALSWLIALPEYCLAVPANRLGSLRTGGAFTNAQLKILQEGLSVAVFLAFNLALWRETPRWQDACAFALILGGLALSLMTRPTAG